ncbi:MAG: hypothetical protein ACK47B_03785 [Armatimonadota bacterium]
MRFFLAFLILSLGAAEASFAQGDSARPSTVFEQVIGRPTGQNGYEELVLAGERVRSSRAWRDAELAGAGATLTQKRRVLADRPVREALALLQAGLAKPIRSPRGELNLATVLPEYSLFRSLARMLVLRTQVLVADGQADEAVRNVELGLRLSRAVQQETVISGLVGIAVAALSVQGIAPYVEALPARECEALFQACTAWLNDPSPLLRILEAERRMLKTSMAMLRAETDANGPGALQGWITTVFNPSVEDTDDSQKLRRLAADLQSTYGGSPQQLAEFYRRMEGQIDRYFDALVVEAKRSRWDAAPPRLPEETPLDRWLARMAPAMDRLFERYSTEDAYVRLLAVHCALHRFQWEQDRLPDTLAELGLPQLCVDPHTGETLGYERLGSRSYRLTSAGSRAEPDDPKAVNGRRPILLGPGG